MRTYSFSLVNARLAYLLTITRTDATVIRVTNYNKSITISGNTWQPQAGIEIGDITEANNGTVPSLSFKVGTVANGTFDPYDIDLGMFEAADAVLEITNAGSPTSKDEEFRGKMKGDVTYDLAGNAQFEILQKYGLARDDFVHQYSIEDDVDFGDPRRSKIPTFPTVDVTSDDLADLARNEAIAVGDRRRFRFASAGNPSDYHNVYLEATSITTGITGSGTPTPSSTVGSTYTDGGVTWTTRNAWARSFQVASIIDANHITITVTEPRASGVTTWFAPGFLVMRSGFMKNHATDIDAWDGTSQIDMVLPIGNLLQVGDWGEIAPDYDQTLDMAVDKYGNAYNYRGFPHLTGARLATSTFIPGTTTDGPTDDPSTGGGGGSGGGYSAFAVEFAAGTS